MRKRDIWIGAGAVVLAILLSVISIWPKAIPTGAWGLSYPSPGQPPSGPAGDRQLQGYDAAYIGDTSQKVLYTTMLMSGALKNHLEEVDKTAEEMFDQLTMQLKAQEGVTEELKANNQLEWVQQMNNIRNRAAEIVWEELIYDEAT